MCSRGSIKTVAGLFLLMSLLPGCGNNSNNISISSNAVSINNASIESNIESNIEASISDNEVTDEAGDNTAISDSSSLNAVSDAVDIKNAKPGDIIVLGEYEQDGDQGKDPIEWIVLDEYEDTITDEEDDEYLEIQDLFERSNLSSINIPDGVETIGIEAFMERRFV